MLDHIRDSLKINILAVEYPGYGIYKPGFASETQIFSDAQLIYNFALKETRLQPNDIILLGRSLGSGPATYLASQN